MKIKYEGGEGSTEYKQEKRGQKEGSTSMKGSKGAGEEGDRGPEKRGVGELHLQLSKI